MLTYGCVRARGKLSEREMSPWSHAIAVSRFGVGGWRGVSGPRVPLGSEAAQRGARHISGRLWMCTGVRELTRSQKRQGRQWRSGGGSAVVEAPRGGHDGATSALAPCVLAPARSHAAQRVLNQGGATSPSRTSGWTFSALWRLGQVAQCAVQRDVAQPPGMSERAILSVT